MNNTDILKILDKTSAFDLYRLQVAIAREIKDPKRIARIKKKLSLGMNLSYFLPYQ